MVAQDLGPDTHVETWFEYQASCFGLAHASPLGGVDGMPHWGGCLAQ